MSGINLANVDLDPLFTGFNSSQISFERKNNEVLEKSLRTLFSQKKERIIKIKNNIKERINSSIVEKSKFQALKLTIGFFYLIPLILTLYTIVYRFK